MRKHVKRLHVADVFITVWITRDHVGVGGVKVVGRGLIICGGFII